MLPGPDRGIHKVLAGVACSGRGTGGPPSSQVGGNGVSHPRQTVDGVDRLAASVDPQGQRVVPGPPRLVRIERVVGIAFSGSTPVRQRQQHHRQAVECLGDRPVSVGEMSPLRTADHRRPGLYDLDGCQGYP